VKDLRAGVIGVGHWAAPRALYRPSRVTLVGSQIRVQSAGKKSPDVMQPFYRSPEELLKAVDLVSVPCHHLSLCRG